MAMAMTAVPGGTDSLFPCIVSLLVRSCHVMDPSLMCRHDSTVAAGRVANLLFSEKSKLLTESRFATMRARDNKMNELKREVITKLAGVASDPKYRDLIRFLIAQGLMTMLEHEVSLQCRQQDLAIVQAELPKALQMFQDQMKGATGISPTCNVTIDLDNFLPPGPKDGQQGASWFVRTHTRSTNGAALETDTELGFLCAALCASDDPDLAVLSASLQCSTIAALFFFVRACPIPSAHFRFLLCLFFVSFSFV